MKLIALTLLFVICSVLAWEEQHDQRNGQNTRHQTTDPEENIRSQNDGEQYVEEFEDDMDTINDEFEDQEDEDEDTEFNEEKRQRTQYQQSQSKVTKSKKFSRCQSQKQERNSQQMNELLEESQDEYDPEQSNSWKQQESCKGKAIKPEIIAAIKAELKTQVIKMAIGKEIDSLLSLVKSEDQSEPVSQSEQEDEKRTQCGGKQSKLQKEKQPKQQKKEQSQQKKGKVGQNFINQGKSQKCKDFVRDDQEEQVETNCKNKRQPRNLKSETEQQNKKVQGKRNCEAKQQEGKNLQKKKINGELGGSRDSGKQKSCPNVRERTIFNTSKVYGKELRSQPSVSQSSKRQRCDQNKNPKAKAPSNKIENKNKSMKADKNVKRR